LTLHELATNAAKYGALAHEGGNLEIHWVVSVDATGRQLTLRWIESGVAGVQAGDIKESFGTKLIKSAVSHDLQGTCDYRLGAGGLNCTLSMRF
jgi:two-component sensor histidine kinase